MFLFSVLKSGVVDIKSGEKQNLDFKCVLTEGSGEAECWAWGRTCKDYCSECQKSDTEALRPFIPKKHPYKRKGRDASNSCLLPTLLPDRKAVLKVLPRMAG